MTHSTRRRLAVLLTGLLTAGLTVRAADNRLTTGAAPAAPAAMDASELAKETQNPVAKMISVPFQNNFNTKMGPDNNQTQYLLNIQPVIPFTLNDDWNLITRTILPVINQPSLYDGMSSPAGLGDLNPSLFLSPAKSGTVIWGAGPTMTFPTATANLLGSGKWSAGPAAVALTMQGPWVIGALANQQWSFAGDSDRRNVSQTLIQPFINYNLPDGWYLSTSPIITSNWKAERTSQEWNVPVGGGGGKVVRIGNQPVNLSLQLYRNLTNDDDAAEWTVRFSVQFLFPSF